MHQTQASPLPCWLRGRVDFHADNEAADADTHIRFSLLHFADSEMQQYIYISRPDPRCAPAMRQPNPAPKSIFYLFV